MWFLERSGLFDPRYLIGMRNVAMHDRDVLARNEALLAKAKSDFIVAVAFFIVEIPLSARLAPQASHPYLSAVREMSYPAISLVRFPFARVEPAISVQRNKQVVALLSTAGMVFFACQQQSHMAEIRCQVFRFGHGIPLFGMFCPKKEDRTLIGVKGRDEFAKAKAGGTPRQRGHRR
jgi:hypothetical protein